VFLYHGTTEAKYHTTLIYNGLQKHDSHTVNIVQIKPHPKQAYKQMLVNYAILILSTTYVM